MMLTLLLSMSSLLVLISVEPLSAIGIFLIICFIPGLSFFYIVRKEKILFKDLVLVFPYSIGISGLLTLGTLFAGIHVKYVSVLICVIVTLIIVFCLVLKRNGRVGPVLALTRQECFFVLFAFLTVLIMSIPYFIGPNRDYVAAHAYHHSSFVSQILNGIFPPENPGLGGTKIGYYWGFHAMVAAIAAQTALHQLQIIFTLNGISLFIVFCMTYVFARAYDLPEGYRYIFPLVLTGLIRPDIDIYFISKLISGTLIPMENIMSANGLSPMEVFGGWLNNLPWYDTRLFFLNKFYNISAMPTAITLCFAYLLMLLLIIRNKTADIIYRIGLFIVIAGCILIYPPLAIFPLLHAPIWSAYIFISNKGSFRKKLGESLMILFPYIMGILTVLPYLLYIMSSRDISSGGQGDIFSFTLYSQSVKNLVVFLIPAPLITYGIWLTFKRFALSRESVFLFGGALLCFVLIVFTRWPFDNSYKFNYVLIIFFSFFFVDGLAGWLSRFSSRLLARLSLTSVMILILMTPIIVEAAYIVSCLSMERRVTFSKGHLVYAQDRDKNEAYAWIRENTPGNSLIMLGYTETNWPCCGLNSSYEAAAFGERTLYVIEDKDYTVSNPEYSKRILFRKKLFENPEAPSVIDHFTSLGRPVYLLIDDTLDRDKFFVEERFEKFPPDPGKEFVPVFQNEKQRVYRLSLNN